MPTDITDQLGTSVGTFFNTLGPPPPDTEEIAYDYTRCTVLSKNEYDGRFMLYAWQMPPRSSPLNQSGNFNIIARVRPHLYNIDKPDHTYPDYPYDYWQTLIKYKWTGDPGEPTQTVVWEYTPQDQQIRSGILYSKRTAAGVARRIADWFQYQSLFKGSGQAHDGMYGGCVILQDIGHSTSVANEPNTSDIFSVQSDLLPNAVPESEWPSSQSAASYRQSYRTLGYNAGFIGTTGPNNEPDYFFKESAMNVSWNSYISNPAYLGRNDTGGPDDLWNLVANRPRWPIGSVAKFLRPRSWIKSVMEQLKIECDRRNLCYPLYVMFDVEKPQIRDDVKLVGRHAATPNSYGGVWNSDKWRSLTGSDKYATETVYQAWNGTEWVDKTWKDAYEEAGSPAYDNTQLYNGSQNNIDFHRKIAPYLQAIQDYGMYKFAYEPTKEVFPHALCGNYDTKFPMSPSKRLREINQTWYTYPVMDFTSNRIFRGDVAAPILYSAPINGSDTYDYNAANNQSGVTFADAYPSTKHPFGTDPQTIYRNYNFHVVEACVAGNNPIECVPWLESPLQNSLDNVFSSKSQTGQYDDILEIMKQAHSNGVRNFQYFNALKTPTNLEYGTPSTIDSNMFANTYKLVTDFSSWLDTEQQVDGDVRTRFK